MASCHVVAQPVASRQLKHTYFTLKYFKIKGTVFTVTAPFIWSRSMCSPRVSASMPKKLQILQEQFRVFKELLGHRIMLTSPSSHSREKDLSWKDPHTLLWVVCVPLWFTWIVFCKFLLFSHINLPKWRLILLGGIQIFGSSPLCLP